MHTHRVIEIPINEALPHFGDVVVVHQVFKKPPSFENHGVTGVCLGHDSRITGGVLIVSVVNGELKEVCSAKVRNLGEKVARHGVSMSIHRTLPRQPMSIVKGKSSGIYKRLKYLRLNRVSVKTHWKSKTFENLV